MGDDTENISIVAATSLAIKYVGPRIKTRQEHISRKPDKRTKFVAMDKDV